MPQISVDKLPLYLKQYRNPDASKKDILGAVQNYRGLSPKVERYVFNDGSQKELVCLDGTIPVSYKGNIYNIPICIWLLDTHPSNAPMVQVKPTADMKIQISRHVDHSGKVYLPYLHEWNQVTSDILSLIQILIITFGEQPPVYAKPRVDPPSYPPNPPYPATQASFMPMPGTQPSTQYPISFPYPPTTAYQPPTSSPFSGFPPYPPSTTSQPAVAGYPPQSTPGYPPYPPSSTGATSTGSSGTISEEHLKASVLSAVEDKVKRRLREHFAQVSAEMEVLRKTQSELNNGQTKLDDIISKLDSENMELNKTIMLLKEKEHEMQEVISKLEGEDSVDVDEAVTTTAPIYKQLFQAFAEEAATEDAIYYLREALGRGVIDLDVFLKDVRILSRRQFMLKALMQKCRQKAGLAG